MFDQLDNGQLSFPPAFIRSHDLRKYVLVTEHILLDGENFIDYTWWHFVSLHCTGFILHQEIENVCRITAIECKWQEVSTTEIGWEGTLKSFQKILASFNQFLKIFAFWMFSSSFKK